MGKIPDVQPVLLGVEALGLLLSFVFCSILPEKQNPIDPCQHSNILLNPRQGFLIHNIALIMVPF
jgi:hypothetical protein